MTYVVTENCIKCKYMHCVEVCPVDCFYARIVPVRVEIGAAGAIG